MKQLLICIALKVLEIGGVIFIPYYAGKLFYKIFHKCNGFIGSDAYYGSKTDCWTYGLFFLVITPLTLATLGIVLFGIGYMIYSYFQFNWNLAGSF